MRKTYLKGDAKVATVGIRNLFPDFALPCAAQHNRRPCAFRHETRRLQVGLLQVDIPAVAAHIRRSDERGALLRNLVHLEDLALDEVVDDASDELDDLALAETGECRARPSQEEVPAEDGILVTKSGWCRRRAPPEVRMVDYVVVQERRDVDHLDYLREARLRRQRRAVVRDARELGGCPTGGRRKRALGRARWDEGEDGGEGGGVVWHVGVPVVEHVRTREWAVELLCAAPRALAIRSPFFYVPVAPKTVRRAREEEDE
jgi:hypothetical protein